MTYLSAACLLRRRPGVRESGTCGAVADLLSSRPSPSGRSSLDLFSCSLTGDKLCCLSLLDSSVAS